VSINKCSICAKCILLLILSIYRGGFGSDTTKVFMPDSLKVSPWQLATPRMTNEPVKPESDIWGTIAGHFKLGYHKVLNKGQPPGTPKLKVNQFYLSLYLESGLRLKYLYVAAFGNLSFPFTQRADGYDHSAARYGGGLQSKIRIWPWWWKLNFLPVGGIEWEVEQAKITLPRFGPDSTMLNLNYRDWGPFYGAELIYSFYRQKNNNLSTLALTYIRYGPRINASTFRLELKVIEFSVSNREYYDERRLVSVDYPALGLELIRWPDGRKSWFLLFSFAWEGEFILK